MSTTPTRVAEEAALRKALASTPRPPRPSALSEALTFGWRGMLKVKHVPEQLLDVTITPVMFVLMSPTCSAARSRGPPASTSITSCPGSS
jgi:ABC-2 type transport system permease protein